MGRGSQLWDRYEAALVKHDYEGLVSMFAEDAVYVEPGGRHEGRTEIRAWLDQWGEATSVARFETLLVIADGDVIIAEYTGAVIHTGPLTMPDGSVIPPSGKTVVFPGLVTILRLKDGQIVDARDYFDQLSMLTQLGLMPGS